jgi:RNA polymerase sigma factor (sigma-70 family)
MGRRADAEELVQEACMLAWHGIEELAQSDARSWLLRTVRSCAYARLRNRRGTESLLAEDVGATDGVNLQQSTLGMPGSPSAAVGRATPLESAMSSLPLYYRESLVLREVHGLTYREIAEITDTSVGTTMSRLSQARSHVTALLRNTGRTDGATN